MYIFFIYYKVQVPTTDFLTLNVPSLTDECCIHTLYTLINIIALLYYLTAG